MTVKKLLPVALFALGLGIAATAHAEADTQKMREKIVSKLQVVPENVSETDIPGLWEVFYEDRIFYVDENVRYLMSGRVYDLQNKEDVTLESLSRNRRAMWAKWPFKDAVKQVFGRGEREIVVFSDANCTYCRALEKTYEKVGNLTVYTFIMPMLRGEENAREIVCARDPGKAWAEWMREHVPPQTVPSDCNTGVLYRNRMLAERYGINSAPTIFFKSGERSLGALTPPQLERALREESGK